MLVRPEKTIEKERIFVMPSRLDTARVVGAAVVLAAFFYARSSPSQSAKTEFPADGSKTVVLDGWYRPTIRPTKKENSAPAPKHDISGTWDPGQAGIQVPGAGPRPDDGNPEHTPPYTPLGLQKLGLTKPSAGFHTVLPTDSNDPAYA